MIVGIDLGTTHSLVAIWRDGRAELIPNALGEMLTPSCVSVDEDGAILVGRAARERLQTHPERTASVFKRYMGSDRTTRLARKDYRPEELSALVLRSLKADAEALLGEPVTEAVITVPAYFSDAQRKATRAAGELAGLKVERLLNEPTAAALAYGMHQMGTETRFLVFDLGGGTFDVSILELFEGVMEVRASSGDNLLGGEDFSARLADRFIEHHALAATIRYDRPFMQALVAQADAAKRTLASGPATLTVRRGEDVLTLVIDEAEFERLVAPLLKRLRDPVERAMRDAGLRANQLDNVVLAGGATRMPLVRRLVTTMFGRFPAIDFNPDEVVALGAAVQAGLLARDEALKEVVMTDVCPYSLGIAIGRHISPTVTTTGHFDPIIERNTPVPVSRVKNYVPLSEQQRTLELEIFQGEARLVKDNIRLGTLKVALPTGAAKAAGSSVEVRFSYDVSGLLQVDAKVPALDKSYTLLIEGNPGMLDAQEIAKRLAALDALKIHPRDTLEVRTLLARAERLYEQLRGEPREWLGSRIEAFEVAVSSQDPRRIEPVQRTLVELLDRLDRDGSVFDDQ